MFLVHDTWSHRGLQVYKKISNSFNDFQLIERTT